MSGVEPDEERQRQIDPWPFLRKPLRRDALEEVLAELAREISSFSLMPRVDWHILLASPPGGPLALPLDELLRRSRAPSDPPPESAEPADPDATP